MDGGEASEDRQASRVLNPMNSRERREGRRDGGLWRWEGDAGLDGRSSEFWAGGSHPRG